MKITAALLFEGDAENIPVELAAFLPITDNRAKARDEQDLAIRELGQRVSSSF